MRRVVPRSAAPSNVFYARTGRTVRGSKRRHLWPPAERAEGVLDRTRRAIVYVGDPRARRWRAATGAAATAIQRRRRRGVTWLDARGTVGDQPTVRRTVPMRRP